MLAGTQDLVFGVTVGCKDVFRRPYQAYDHERSHLYKVRQKLPLQLCTNLFF